MKTTHSSALQKGVDRRTFLKLSGMLGLGAAAVPVLATQAEAVRFNRDEHKVSMTRVAMGTFVSMTLIHPSRDEAQDAMGRAFDEIDRLSRELSRFDSATAVSHLNSEGTLRDVPPELADVIDRSLRYYRLSNGCFDITVKPIVDLFQACFDMSGQAQTLEPDLEKVLPHIGAEKIVFSGRTLRFAQPGMGITLDGIAKGYIVDRASEMLTRLTIRNHLINAGGDIRTCGSKEHHKPWSIAIQDPQKQKRYPDVIRLSEGAVATSGNYEVYYDHEKMFHHIVNPKNGHSPLQSSSVSVCAATTMDADALSTTAFVMEPAQGLRFIESLPRCEAFILTRAGDTFKSSGWGNQAI